jgi:hypothetical protein
MDESRSMPVKETAAPTRWPQGSRALHPGVEGFPREIHKNAATGDPHYSLRRLFYIQLAWRARTPG